MTTTSVQHFMTSDGVNLVADVLGPLDGPSVILLHGAGQTRHSWKRLALRLARSGYRVVSYDARGHGDSGWAPSQDYSLAAFSMDLRTLRKAVKGPVTLVGASLGGMAAFHAVGHSPPDFAQALVMVDIALGADAAGERRIVDFMRRTSGGFSSIDDAVEAVTQYNPGRAKPVTAHGLTRSLRAREDRFFWHWDPLILGHPSRTESSKFAAELKLVAEKVTLPVMLVCGALSDVVTEKSVADMIEMVPQTEVYKIDRAAHMIVGHDNNEFTDEVVRFIASHLNEYF